MFMYFGLILSDYAFDTDRWYWQTLCYILSLIIIIVELSLTLYLPFIFLVLGDKMPYSRAEHVRTVRHGKKSKKRLKLILYILLLLANIAFSIFSLYFVIRYIVEFKKTRD
jgi:hypothetical protein